MSTTHTLTKGDFIRDGRGPAMTTVCTTGDESGGGGTNPAAVTDTAGDGKQYPDTALSLSGCAAVDRFVEAELGSTFGSGGRLEAWIYNQFHRQWCRCPDLDLNLTEGLDRQMFAPLKVDARLGWLCYLPNNAGCGLTIILTAQPVRI